MGTRARQLVGRGRELGLLEIGLAETRHANGGSFFLIGEPGIGKSRLASESERLAAAAGMVLLRGRGSSVGPTVPFRPFAEALMSLSRGGESPLLAELGAYRPILSRLIPDFHDLAKIGRAHV